MFHMNLQKEGLVHIKMFAFLYLLNSENKLLFNKIFNIEKKNSENLCKKSWIDSGL